MLVDFRESNVGSQHGMVGGRIGEGQGQGFVVEKQEEYAKGTRRYVGV